MHAGRRAAVWPSLHVLVVAATGSPRLPSWRCLRGWGRGGTCVATALHVPATVPARAAGAMPAELGPRVACRLPPTSYQPRWVDAPMFKLRDVVLITLLLTAVGVACGTQVRQPG